MNGKASAARGQRAFVVMILRLYEAAKQPERDLGRLSSRFEPV